VTEPTPPPVPPYQPVPVSPYPSAPPVPGGEPGPPSAPYAWAPAGPGTPSKKSNRTLIIVVAVVVGLLVLCCIGGVIAVANSGDSDKAAMAANSPAASTASGVTTNSPATKAAPTTAAETTSAAPTLPKDLTYTGRGDKVLKLSLPDEYRHLAAITHQGGSLFIVRSIDSHGVDIDLLVNEIGSYAGTVPLNLTTDADDLRALKIIADGTWKVVIKVIQKATRFNGSVSGKGDSVLIIPEGTLPDLATAKVTHKGDSNFVVKSYSDSDVDLLVNEIGKYSGEILIADDTVILEIEANGSWTIKLE
jgi:hypothetical protein